MVNNEPQNCWEFWNCDLNIRKDCPAFTTNSGRECWLIAGSFSKRPNCPKVTGVNKIIKACWECPWYKKLNE